jgi:hypothetical protein
LGNQSNHRNGNGDADKKEPAGADDAFGFIELPPPEVLSDQNGGRHGHAEGAAHQ